MFQNKCSFHLLNIRGILENKLKVDERCTIYNKK